VHHTTNIPDIPPNTYDDLPFVEKEDDEEDSNADDEGLDDNDDEEEEDEGPQEDGDIFGEPEAVDASPKRKRKKRKKATARTPIKHRWIVPLIEDRMRERPNLSKTMSANICCANM
jgi:hypothetical protein